MLLLALAFAAEPAAPNDATAVLPDGASPSPTVGPVEVPPPLEPIPGSEQAVTLYLQALDAWQLHQHEAALALATRATHADPLLGEAWLLRSYAHRRVGEAENALTTAKLAREDERADVRASARAQVSRLTQPQRRDSPALSMGGGSAMELRYGEVVPRVDLSLAVSMPLPHRFSAKSEVRWAAMNPDDLQVGGAKLSLTASRSVPIIGKLAFNGGLGPSLWIATGQYWASGSHPWLGVRADAELDVRFSAAFGLYLGATAEVYPAQIADLSWLNRPLALQTGVRFWFWGGA